MTNRINGGSSSSASREVQLRFTGDAADQHLIAAGQLAASIDALRRSVELAALEVLGIELRVRDRLTPDLQRQYGLYVAAPAAGSLVINGRVGGPLEQLDAEDNLDKIALHCQGAWQALCEGDWPALNRLFPDRIRLRRWIDSSTRLAPKASSRVSIQLGLGSVVLALDGLAERAAEFRSHRAAQATRSPINGYLAEIDFLNRTFKLHYPEGQRLICGSYNEEAEEFLLANPRELIQVTALVLHDGDGRPIEISDAIAFDSVDVTPITITVVPLSEGQIKAVEPFDIGVSLDESQQYLTANFEPLGLDLSARTRHELRHMIMEDLDVLWRNIARADTDALTPSAQRLKAWLQAHFTEAKDAAR